MGGGETQQTQKVQENKSKPPVSRADQGRFRERRNPLLESNSMSIFNIAAALNVKDIKAEELAAIVSKKLDLSSFNNRESNITNSPNPVVSDQLKTATGCGPGCGGNCATCKGDNKNLREFSTQKDKVEGIEPSVLGLGQTSVANVIYITTRIEELKQKAASSVQSNQSTFVPTNEKGTSKSENVENSKLKTDTRALIISTPQSVVEVPRDHVTLQFDNRNYTVSNSQHSVTIVMTNIATQVIDTGKQSKQETTPSTQQEEKQKCETQTTSELQHPSYSLSTKSNHVNSRSNNNPVDVSDRCIVSGYTYTDILTIPWLRKLYGHLIGLCDSSNDSIAISDLDKKETKQGRNVAPRYSKNDKDLDFDTPKPPKWGIRIKQQPMPKKQKERLHVRFKEAFIAVEKLLRQKDQVANKKVKKLGKEFGDALKKIEKRLVDRLRLLKDKQQVIARKDKLYKKLQVKIEKLERLVRLLKRKKIIASLLLSNKKRRKNNKSLVLSLIQFLKKFF